LAEETEIVVGSVVEGVVSGITRFGAFVLLPGGKTGLVHISEVADAYVNDIKEYLKENDRVKVKVLTYDGNQKIGLSIRQAQPGPRGGRTGGGSGFGGGRGRGAGRPQNFEDKLARFMKESEDKQADLRRHHDLHRGGHGRGHGEGAM